MVQAPLDTPEGKASTAKYYKLTPSGEAMLFGLTPTDPGALGGAIVLLTVAAQIASYLPARRAARVDPLTALRHG